MGVRLKGRFNLERGVRASNGYMKRRAGTRNWSRSHLLIADFLYPEKFYICSSNVMDGFYAVRSAPVCTLLGRSIHILLILGRRSRP